MDRSILATIAVAYEPLSAAAIDALMTCQGMTTGPDTIGRRLMELSPTIVRRQLASSPDGGWAFLSFSEKLRLSYVLESEVAAARSLMCSATLDWRTVPGALDYLLRWGLAHLMEADRATEAASLLGSYPFLNARSEILLCAPPNHRHA